MPGQGLWRLPLIQPSLLLMNRIKCEAGEREPWLLLSSGGTFIRRALPVEGSGPAPLLTSATWMRRILQNESWPEVTASTRVARNTITSNTRLIMNGLY